MIILKIIWFFLPAYVANMSASIFKIKILDKPISEELFGSHKTWSGFAVGTFLAILISCLQRLFASLDFLKQISLLNYSDDYLLIGLLLGFGALFGDLIKSFFKRRIGVAPGEKWIPFDQIDYTLGALILSLFIFQPSWFFVLAAIVFNFLMHILFNHLGFWLGIRKKAW
jgi:CDP-2,3-bis-(O-geranylgeranyl)-sn-glycerol synthase